MMGVAEESSLEAEGLPVGRGPRTQSGTQVLADGGECSRTGLRPGVQWEEARHLCVLAHVGPEFPALRGHRAASCLPFYTFPVSMFTEHLLWADLLLREQAEGLPPVPELCPSCCIQSSSSNAQRLEG